MWHFSLVVQTSEQNHTISLAVIGEGGVLACFGAHVLALSPHPAVPLPRLSLSPSRLRTGVEHRVLSGVDHPWAAEVVRSYVLDLDPSFIILAPFPRVIENANNIGGKALGTTEEHQALA